MTLDLTEFQFTIGWHRQYLKVYLKKGSDWVDITHEYTGNEDPDLQYSSIRLIFDDVIGCFISDYFEDESTPILKDIDNNFLSLLENR